MREGLKGHNLQNDVPDGEFEGCNETTTHAFMHFIHTTMNVYGAMYPTPDAGAFCERHPQLMCKHVLRLLYSPERRRHPDTKRRFVEPDLAPLPKIANAP